MKSGSGESLKVSTRWGFSPKARQIRDDRRLAHARRLGHRAGRPVRGVGRRLFEGLYDHRLDVIVSRSSAALPAEARHGGRPGARLESVAAICSPCRVDPETRSHLVVVAPSAHASTMRQRKASAWALFGRRAQRSRVARSSSAQHHGLENGLAHVRLPSSLTTRRTRHESKEIPSRLLISDSGH